MENISLSVSKYPLADSGLDYRVNMGFNSLEKLEKIGKSREHNFVKVSGRNLYLVLESSANLYEKQNRIDIQEPYRKILGVKVGEKVKVSPIQTEYSDVTSLEKDSKEFQEVYEKFSVKILNKFNNKININLKKGNDFERSIKLARDYVGKKLVLGKFADLNNVARFYKKSRLINAV